MGDQQNGRILFAQDIEGLVTDAVAQAIVEARKRLVHQHDAGARGKGACQRHALLLATRQLMRIRLVILRQPHALQQFGHPRGIRLSVTRQTERHVLFDAEMREKREILKHQADMATFRRDTKHRVADQIAIDMDLALILHLDTRDHPQRCRFATARRAEQAGHLSRHDTQRHVLDHHATVVTPREIVDFEPGDGDLRSLHRGPLVHFPRDLLGL